MSFTFPFKQIIGKKVQVAAAFVLAAVLIGGVTAAIAETDGSTQTGTTTTQDCKVFNTAVSAAMQNHMSIVDRFFTSAQKGVKSAMNNSCLQAIQLLDLNLAGLIPDFNIFGKILDLAVEKASAYITSQVCQAVSSVIGEWNGIVGALKVDWNANTELEKWGNSVVAEVPGGNAPLLNSNSQGVVGSGGSINLLDEAKKGAGSTPVNCYQTLAGTVCSDGSSGTGASSGAGTSTGTDYASNSVNGAQVGAQYAQLKQACSTAQSQWSSAKSSQAGVSYIERLRLSAVSTCKTAQDYYSTYQTYLSSAGPVSIMTGLNTPTQSTSDSASSYSLPVRD